MPRRLSTPSRRPRIGLESREPIMDSSLLRDRVSTKAGAVNSRVWIVAPFLVEGDSQEST